MPAEGWLSGSAHGDAVFFALMPDASAALRLAEVGRALRLKHGLTGRLLAPEHLHLPLIGLGRHATLPPQLVDLAIQAAAAIIMSSFDVVLDRARSLGSLRRSLVLYGDDGLSGARVLQLAIEFATHELGIGAARRSLMPHVTVLDGWSGIVEEAIEPVRWTANEFVLLHSLRGRRESIVLGRWALPKGIDRPRGFEEPAIAIGWCARPFRHEPAGGVSGSHLT
jgi:2'-5' RNA ligase